MIPSFILTLLGLTLFSLTLKRHRKQAWPKYSVLGVTQINLLKCGGWACLIFATVLSAESFGWARGLVYQCAWLTLAGFWVSLLLSYRPQWLPTGLGISGAILIASLSL